MQDPRPMFPTKGYFPVYDYRNKLFAIIAFIFFCGIMMLVFGQKASAGGHSSAVRYNNVCNMMGYPSSCELRYWGNPIPVKITITAANNISEPGIWPEFQDRKSTSVLFTWNGGAVSKVYTNAAAGWTLSEGWMGTWPCITIDCVEANSYAGPSESDLLVIDNISRKLLWQHGESDVILALNSSFGAPMYAVPVVSYVNSVTVLSNGEDSQAATTIVGDVQVKFAIPPQDSACGLLGIELLPLLLLKKRKNPLWAQITTSKETI